MTKKYFFLNILNQPDSSTENIGILEVDTVVRQLHKLTHRVILGKKFVKPKTNDSVKSNYQPN